MSDLSGLHERILSHLNVYAPDLALKKSQADTRGFSGPPVPSSIGTFLSFKLSSLHREFEYLDSLQDGLRDLQNNSGIPIRDARQKRNKIERLKIFLRGEILAIKLRGNVIIEDMTSQLECFPFPRMETAYNAVMMTMIYRTTRKQRKSHWFKDRALEFYEASRTVEKRQEKQRFCHLLGWQVAPAICVAHIAPKSFDEDSLAHLFGRDLTPEADPRNALSLTRGLQKALHRGQIVFIPVPGEKNAWKCVVTLSDGLNDMVHEPYTWKDINGRRLFFNNVGRPRNGYLFYRYLITYLRHKQDGTLKWAEDIESEFRVWVGSGPCRCQSTLRVLLQQATGQELPEIMFRMFEGVTDSGIRDLSDRERNHHTEQISYALAKAVHPIHPDSESDEEYETDG